MGLKDVLAATQAEVLSLHKKDFNGVGTDTRADLHNQMFIALRGPNFDAHNFVDKAVEKKAAILLLDKKDVAEKWVHQITCLLVNDTLKALHSLAHYWRRSLSAKVVGITGSNGKTTTKEFLSRIAQKAFHTRASQGSFNNHWGVPLTLLSCQKSDEVVILEMGMNHLGELKQLSQIAEPDITLVTNVGSSHIGHVGSLGNIARAKSEIYLANPHSQGVFNLDNKYTLQMYKDFHGLSKFTFSESKEEAHVCFSTTQSGLDFIQVEGKIGAEKGSAKIPIFGQHNVQNALAASAAAIALGVPPQKIWAALELCQNSWGRNQWVDLQSGAKVLFDAYNSNPESLMALIESFEKFRPPPPSNNNQKIFHKCTSK